MLLLLAGCSAPPFLVAEGLVAEGPGAEAPFEEDPVVDADPPRVVIVVLDGARLDETLGEGVSSLSGGPTADLLPELRARLLPAATLVRGARATGVPITTESHTELLTGLRQDLATFAPADGTAYRSDVPTLFEVARAQGGLDADQAVMIVNTVLVEDLASSAWPGLGASFGATHRFRTENGTDLADATVLDDLRTWLSGHDTRIALANLHAIDLAGHDGDSDAYTDRVRAVDAPVAELWEWIEATEPYAGRTTLVVLADHGRHRGEDGSWSNHGDQCDGCREIPLLFAGPGIRAGAVVDVPATLADVASTLAWQLGVELPNGSGRVLTEIFVDPPSVPGPGPMAVAAADGHLAVEEDGIVVDGVRRSDPGARHAEAPVLATLDGGLVACWRELVLPTETAAGGTWRARCERDGVDLAFPEDVAGARWRPALVAPVTDPGALWAAWIDNPYGYTGVGSAHVRLSRWSAADGWSATDDVGPTPSLPTHVSLARTAAASVLAFAASGVEDRGRDTRQVEVWRVEDDDPATWTRVSLYEPDATDARLEAPVLHPGGKKVAFFGYGTGTSLLVGARGERTRVDTTGRALPHIGASWSGDALVWARLDPEGLVELCRYEDDVTEVIATGATTIAGLAVDGTEVVATVDGAVVRYAWE